MLIDDCESDGILPERITYKQIFKLCVAVAVIIGVTVYCVNGATILLGQQLGAQVIKCNWAFCEIQFFNTTYVGVHKCADNNGTVKSCLVVP